MGVNQRSNSKETRYVALVKRKGVVAICSAVMLAALFAFVAMGVDTARIVTVQTQMQNAVDAAALAASQEITGAVFTAGQQQGDVNLDANSIAVANARLVAAEVAEANGVYIDPDLDVAFGKRVFDEQTGTWPIQWGQAPYNVVQVTARRTEEDTSAPDGKLKLAFGWAVGKPSVPLTVSASAFVEARDMVLVLDFSASMNDDSSMKSFNSLGQSHVEQTLDSMWDALVAADPKWPGTNESKFPSTGFGLVNSYYGTYLSSSDTTDIYYDLQLYNVPFPQAGRYSSGLPKNKPSSWDSEYRWRDYIWYVKNKSGTYRKRYGYRTLMDYLQEYRYYSNRSEDLWRTPHYPFHAVKEGASLFCGFLEDLDFGDQLGLVSYGGYSVKEVTFNDGELSYDLTDDPIVEDYSVIDTIQRRKQAGHYNGWTGMGYGIRDAREMLLGDPDSSTDNGYSRYGSRPTMIVMTDGQTNQGPSDWSLPGDWNWADWTDYDGDGTADYTTSNSKKQYAFWQATEAVRMGITIHTMSVGAGADRDLMKAIAFAGSGVWIDVPGGSTVADMETQMLAAFSQIAAKVPPAKLIYDDGSDN